MFGLEYAQAIVISAVLLSLSIGSFVNAVDLAKDAQDGAAASALLARLEDAADSDVLSVYIPLVRDFAVDEVAEGYLVRLNAATALFDRRPYFEPPALLESAGRVALKARYDGPAVVFEEVS